MDAQDTTAAVPVLVLRQLKRGREQHQIRLHVAAAVAPLGPELQALRDRTGEVETPLGLRTVAAQFPEQEQHAPLEQGPPVVDGLQNAILVVFAEFDAVAGMVRVGGSFFLVFVRHIVSVFRVKIDQTLEVAVPFLKVVQTPGGPFRPRLPRHVRLGISGQFPHAFVGCRLRPFQFPNHSCHGVSLRVSRLHSTPAAYRPRPQAITLHCERILAGSTRSSRPVCIWQRFILGGGLTVLQD